MIKLEDKTTIRVVVIGRITYVLHVSYIQGENGLRYSNVMSGAHDGTVLQNICSVDIVSWLAKSAEQITNLYKCCINL